jgi:hypothetical protein
MIEVAVFYCHFAQTSRIKANTKLIKREWRANQITSSSNPCNARLYFEKDFGDEWSLKEAQNDHNHEADTTIMSNETINFIDDLVTGRGCNIAPMEVLAKLRQRFGREYDVPVLFHHLSQRFDLVHKSDNIEFVKELAKEYTKDFRDSIIDEI